MAYFEKEQRELVNLNYAEPVRSPLAAPNPEALGYSAYFAELLDEWAADADPDERLYRLGTATLEALAAGGPVAPLARYFECWLLRLQGVYPADVACAGCGADFAADDGAYLAVEGHGFVCRRVMAPRAPMIDFCRPGRWRSSGQRGGCGRWMPPDSERPTACSANSTSCTARCLARTSTDS